MPNIRLTLAYDGTAYHGFQKQSGSGLATVQGTLEECLAELAGAPVPVIGAGRTDAGVHARGQVVSFHTGDWRIPTARITAALNGALPGDMVALDAREVPADFHARYSATAKTYSYTILNGLRRCPFARLYSLHVREPLDLGAMRQGARHLVGRHDFSAFQATGRPVKSAVRTLSRAQVQTRRAALWVPLTAGDASITVGTGQIPAHSPLPVTDTGVPAPSAPEPLLTFIRLVFRADGFLYNMVRIMVGTLLEVGLGRMDPDTVRDVVAARDRQNAGATAPAHGLCLESVEYPE